MLKTFFLWAFVVVPLGIAIALLLYRGRYFIVTIAALMIVMAGIWTALRLEESISAWWYGAPPAVSDCTNLPPGTPLPEECAL
jgi:hypothetical protein